MAREREQPPLRRLLFIAKQVDDKVSFGCFVFGLELSTAVDRWLPKRAHDEWPVLALLREDH